MAEQKLKEVIEEARVALGVNSKEPVLVEGSLVSNGITEEEAADLKARAHAIARQLEEACGSKEMEIIDSVTTLGLQTQRQAASQFGLLQGRLRDAFTQNDSTRRVTADLVELRFALKEIASADWTRRGLLHSLLNALPFRRRFLRFLEKIAVRYEPVSRQVMVIENRLRQGRMMLTRDNVELRKLYEQVEAQQPAVRKNAYLGERLMQELQTLMERTSEPRKKENIQSALHDVAMRVQDLRTMQEVHSQFFVSIEMTRHNNTRLGQAVERTLTLATNVVTVGLAIQLALARQKRILEATQRTREFLGAMIVTNAETIKRHTEEIGDVYNEPVIAVEKIAQAHDALIEAIESANRLKEDGIASARENISKLSRLAGVLEERFAGTRQLPEGKSLEA